MGLTDFVNVLNPNGGRNLQLYSNAYVIMNGSLVAQNASIQLEKKSNSTPVHTLAAGFAGMSQGSGLIELTITNAIPSKDFEWCPDVVLREGSAIEVGVVIAGRQSIFKGFVTDAIYTHSVNEASKLNMKLTCRFASFE